MKSLFISVGIITLVMSVLIWMGECELSRFASGLYAFCAGAMLLTNGLKAVHDD